MAINPVSSNVRHTAPIQQQKQPSNVKEVENDKDKDDSGSTVAAQVAPRSTVNTSGQVVGSHINTQAWVSISCVKITV